MKNESDMFTKTRRRSLRKTRRLFNFQEKHQERRSESSRENETEAATCMLLNAKKTFLEFSRQWVEKKQKCLDVTSREQVAVKEKSNLH